RVSALHREQYATHTRSRCSSISFTPSFLSAIDFYSRYSEGGAGDPEAAPPQPSSSRLLERGLVVLVLVVLHDRLRCRLRGLLRSCLARDNLGTVVTELHARSPRRRLQTLGPHSNRDTRLDDDISLTLCLAQGEVQLLTLVHRKDHVTL